MGLLRNLFRSSSVDAAPSSAGRPDRPPTPTAEDDGSWYVPADVEPGRFTGPDGLPALHLIAYLDSAGEGVLRLVEDATGLLIGPTHRALAKAGVHVSQLRGESHYEDACRRGDFSPGTPVQLVREPDNPHDPNAVAVLDVTGQHKAAYVNKQKARTLTKLLDAGTPLAAVSVRGTAAGRDCPQVAVVVAAPEVLARLLEPRPQNLPTPAHLR